MKTILRRGALTAVATALAGSALAVAPAPAYAATCRDGIASINGARLEFEICVDAIGTGLRYFLEDTDKDGRRAEVYLITPATSAFGVELDEAARGVGDWADGEWYGLFKSGVYLKLCTSDANTDRRCGSRL
ncbi:hypothetical protein AB0B66_20675 [Catellatospora sp. NPDC049111]|uniref:hypothetical protein n=1 Tax=Catellatospora sp. NPDC049111 TaxID=3155271 RepID=UPI00340D2E61